MKFMCVKAGRRSLQASIPAQRGCASAFFFFLKACFHVEKCLKMQILT